MFEILGSNGGMDPQDGTTAFLLNEAVLLDAGTGLEQLPLARQRKIRTVLVSHSHLDHHAHLAFLANNLVSEISTPLEVIATETTITALRAHIYNDIIWPDFSRIPNPTNPVLHFNPMPCGIMIERHGMRFQMIEVNHSVPTVGYWIEDLTAGYRCGFTSDCFTNDNYWSVLNGLPRVDDLIVDCQYLNSEKDTAALAKHYYAEGLAADLQKLCYKPRILLTHIPMKHRALVLDEVKTLIPDHEVAHIRDIAS